MLRAAVRPWLCATDQCSMRRLPPPAGKRATSRAGPHEFVDDDAAVDLQARLFREARLRPHADPHHDEVGGQPRPVVERHVTL
jgi:hypothetical protein